MTTRLSLVLACLVVALAAAPAPARASVWSDATQGASATEARDLFDKQMAVGDQMAAAALDEGQTRKQTELDIDAAVVAYTTAAELEPTSGEPYARISKLLYSFYFERCLDPLQAQRFQIVISPLCRPFRPDRAHQTIDAWNALEARAPLDPRIASCFDPGRQRCTIFERAILNTRLATPASLAAAAVDYRSIVDHAAIGSDLGVVANNLAETYMMLGRLDEAIDTYRLSLTYRTDISTELGLAVALDRDDQAAASTAIIDEVGPAGFETFVEQVRTGDTFFVPEGEVNYYLALVHENHGALELAIDEWKAFLASGAHPQYQPRARQHLTALLAQQQLHPQILRPVKPKSPLDE